MSDVIARAELLGIIGDIQAERKEGRVFIVTRDKDDPNDCSQREDSILDDLLTAARSKLSEGSGGLKLVYDKDKRTIVAVSESGKRFSLVAEGSGDGKMRELLEAAKQESSNHPGAFMDGARFIVKALATPAPSPSDTEA